MERRKIGRNLIDRETGKTVRVVRVDVENIRVRPKPQLRTLEQVKETLAQASKTKADKAMARLMVDHGRMTDAAREYVVAYLKG
jgi:hypothetical protein